MDECIRFNGKFLEELKTRTSWFWGGLQKTMIGKKPDAHEAGVTTILAWRFEFMSNYGRQDINPKNFSWFGDFSRKVGFHIFMSCKPKHVISENLMQKTLCGHLVFSFFFLSWREWTGLCCTLEAPDLLWGKQTTCITLFWMGMIFIP